MNNRFFYGERGCCVVGGRRRRAETRKKSHESFPDIILHEAPGPNRRIFINTLARSYNKSIKKKKKTDYDYIHIYNNDKQTILIKKKK